MHACTRPKDGPLLRSPPGPAAGRSGQRRPAGLAAEIASGIDALTDGLWLRLHLSTASLDTAQALRITPRFMAAAVPDRAGEIEAGLCDGETA